jgi:hypothetical protein
LLLKQRDHELEGRESQNELHKQEIAALESDLNELQTVRLKLERESVTSISTTLHCICNN